LYKYLSQFGKVRTLKLHSKRTGESRGFGFATYETTGALEKAIEAAHSINGKNFECKKVVSQEEAKLKEKLLLKRKIFVGGLEKSVKEEELVKYFSTFGLVEKAIISREHYTDVSRGCGFIIFKSVKSAKKTLYFKGTHKLNGKQFGCKSCKSRDEINTKAPNPAYQAKKYTPQRESKKINSQNTGKEQFEKNFSSSKIRTNSGTSLEYSKRKDTSDGSFTFNNFKKEFATANLGTNYNIPTTNNDIREQRQANPNPINNYGFNSFFSAPQEKISSLKSTEMLDDMSKKMGFYSYKQSLKCNLSLKSPLLSNLNPPMLNWSFKKTRNFDGQNLNHQKILRVFSGQNPNICFNLQSME